MKVSIIINTYNGNQEHLIQSLESCSKQKGVDAQIIVSTVRADPSLKIIRQMKNLDVDLVINERPGIYSQLNNATNKIKNDWFYYFSGNDVALPEKSLNEISLCLRNNKKVCYSSFYKSNDVLEGRKRLKFYDYSLEKHLSGNFVADVSTLNSNVLFDNLPFDEGLGNFAYWDLWLRIAKKDPNAFIYNQNPEWIYRISNDSRHVKRKTNKNDILKNHNEKLKMFKKHKDLYVKYRRLDVITNLENIIKTVN